MIKIVIENTKLSGNNFYLKVFQNSHGFPFLEDHEEGGHLPFKKKAIPEE